MNCSRRLIALVASFFRREAELHRSAWNERRRSSPLRLAANASAGWYFTSACQPMVLRERDSRLRADGRQCHLYRSLDASTSSSENIAKGAASVAAMLVTLAFVCKHGTLNKAISICGLSQALRGPFRGGPVMTRQDGFSFLQKQHGPFSPIIHDREQLPILHHSQTSNSLLRF